MGINSGENLLKKQDYDKFRVYLEKDLHRNDNKRKKNQFFDC
jgi:hypothetical protein